MAAQAVAKADVDKDLHRNDQLYADVRDWITALEPDARFVETENARGASDESEPS